MSRPSVVVEVLVEDPAWRKVPRVKSLAARAAEAALAAAIPEGVRATACVALIDDAAIARLNHDFRGQPTPTDVLAFPQLPGGTRSIAARLRKHAGQQKPVALGDVVVALGTCTRGARAARIALADHIAHLVAHGALHLLGHDHGEAGETARMRALERKALARLGIADPYRSAAPRPRGKGTR